MAEPEYTFAMMLSELSAVQAFLGAADAEEAYESIYIDELPWPADADVGYTKAELEALRPYILVSRGEIRGFRDSSSGFGETSRMFVEMRQDPPDGYAASKTTFDAAGNTFKASCRNVLDAIKLSTKFTIGDYEVLGRGWAAPELHTDEGEWQGIDWAFSVQYGISHG